MLKVKRDFVYKDIDGVRYLGGKTFEIDFEVSPNEVDTRAMEGNMACFNFCYRRDDFDHDFNKKLYYGHITMDDGSSLGYVMCEDELEEEKEIMKKYKELLKNKSVITRLVVMLAILFLLLFCTGCNKQVIDFDYKFDKAICNIGGEYKEIEIKMWNDYDGEQLQITDKEGNKYLVSSFNCTLIKED